MQSRYSWYAKILCGRSKNSRIFWRAVDEDDVLVCAVAGPGPVEVVEGHDALAVAKGRIAIDDPATMKVVANDKDVVALNKKTLKLKKKFLRF
jgi:hypothetical protein